MGLTAAALRHHLEAKLAGRIPAALSPVPAQVPRLFPTGNGHLDGLLGGGLPLGSVCEMTGPEGAGHSSLALSLVAGASREGACAYLDAGDTLSPESAAAAGVELGNLLWVRFPASVLAEAPVRSLMASGRPLPPEDAVQRPIYSGCGSSHPRTETKGLAPALEQMLFYKEERRRRKLEGTPGHPNQPLGLHTASREQVDWERWNLRRVDEDDPLRISDRQAAEAARQRAAASGQAQVPRPRQSNPWDRLDRVLRATDLLLQSGGFRVVVMDLASVEPAKALRIPAATWFRFRRAAQEGDCILLLLTRERCAGSSAACALVCSTGAPPVVEGVLQAAPRMAEMARQRTGPALGRKAPGRATGWDANPAWMRAVGS